MTIKEANFKAGRYRFWVRARAPVGFNLHRARSIGIELEPAYVNCARQTADSLNLGRVAFIRQDARSADLSNGTVFYLYTPFTGAILRATLELLRRQAKSRPIRICAFGPCASTIAAEDWLDAMGDARPDRISIFRSLPSTLAI